MSGDIGASSNAPGDPAAITQESARRVPKQTDRPKRRGRALARLSGALLTVALGCGTLQSNRDRLQTLVGTSSQDLVTRLGAPARILQENDAEYMLYEFVLEDIDPEAERPNIPYGSFENFDEFAEPVQVDALCQLALEVRDGKVAAVQCEGRTSNGLLANALCIRTLVTRLELDPER